MGIQHQYAGDIAGSVPQATNTEPLNLVSSTGKGTLPTPAISVFSFDKNSALFLAPLSHKHFLKLDHLTTAQPTPQRAEHQITQFNQGAISHEMQGLAVALTRAVQTIAFEMLDK